MSASTGTSGRATSTNGGQSGVIDLLAGLVVDPNEELPTSNRGRKADPVLPEYAAVFAKLISGEARALIWPPKGTDADKGMVDTLRKQATKFFKNDPSAAGKRPAYTTAATDKDGAQTRVCFEVKSK